MSKLFSFLITGLLCAGSALAQSSADSVKVRLRTSAGAEIGIDGDMSSTNLLTKKVAVGQHVVVVTYGTSYKKEHTVSVTPSQTEYDFSIDGQLTVNSQPSGRTLYIDGIQQGRTPLTLPVLGEHNLRLEGDAMSYFDYTERVSVGPFSQVERNLTLRKRPPRTYGMLLVNYEPSASAFGLTLAIVKRWGVYARMQKTSDDLSHHNNGTEFHGSPGIYKKDATCLFSATGGLIFRLAPFLYFYGGAGYGEYGLNMKPVQASHNDKYSPLSSKGLMGDAGVILKWKALIGQVGYNMIFGESTPEPYKGLYLGLGITIHKQKKDKQ